MSSADLGELRAVHQLRATRIAALLRIGAVLVMIAAMMVGTPRHEWPREAIVLAFYSVATLAAAVLAFSPSGAAFLTANRRFWLAIGDVLVLLTFQLVSTGGYLPLLVMALIPLIVVPQLSWRRAVVVLVVSVGAFVVAVLEDPDMLNALNWGETTLVFHIYVFLCVAGLLVAYVEGRHVHEIAKLSVSREELLGQVMTAAEAERRRVSEQIHDGPLQDILVARQDVAEIDGASDPETVQRAAESLRQASQGLREAIYALHPAVLAEVGLGAAVEQLVSVTANRSGIDIAAYVDYPGHDPIDVMVFGAVRELLSNVVRHSRATQASVELGTERGRCVLVVTDNGIGTTPEAAAQRVAEGHIGVASHRARLEAAGGSLTFVEVPVGTRVRVEVPLRG